MNDPRHLQIGILCLLLAYSLLFLNFEIRADIAAIIIISSQLTQYFFIRLKQLPHFDPRSTLITSLSLCLLLRTNEIELAAVTASLAVASKFLIRYRNKHLFNPSNIALVFMLLCTDKVWVSSGLWGQTILLAALLACLGMLVLLRSQRTDITLAFLGFYIALLVARAQWLGDPLTIPVFQLQSGALLIFAFFMISDPMSTPNTRIGRVLFAAMVVLVTGYIQFILYRPNGILFALAVCSLFAPVIDRVFPGQRFQWQASASKNISNTTKG